jgi:signal recognition particle subunit SRP68
MGVKFGTRMKFVKKDIAKERPDDNKILQVLLFNAEKNWAYANETKYSITRKASQKSRARFFSIKKLKKAVEWASRLHAVCKEKTDNATQLEAQAYTLFLEGTLEF